MHPLKDKKILLAVTGGIACYKALDLARELMREGAAVRVLMTKAAQEFVRPLSFQTLTGQAVLQDLFSLTDEAQIGHIEAAKWPDLILIAPATANSIAKAALGLAEDYLGTLLLATRAPLVLCPAMNPQMYSHPKTQAHLQTLKAEGAVVVEPEEGLVACGDHGQGRLASMEQIVDAVRERLLLGVELPLTGIKALVTAGPTRERIDAVRFITNDSSGKMGYALAAELHRQGAEVVLISGPVALPEIPGVKRILVESAQEMLEAALPYQGARLIIGAAAVADVAIKNPSTSKIKKSELKAVEFQQNPDIIHELAKRKKSGQILVGFAAETEDLVANAQSKLERKGLDLVIGNAVNQPGGVFGSEDNQVVLVTQEEIRHFQRMPKPLVAQAIVEELARMLG